ncbi:UNVERIFIED_CONTAM: hypothetical protein Scaly_3044300, partial [Sesamum calycinum]
MEYWTNDGLSTVASGVGTPLYVDRITKDCSRLDFARVCVMLDYNSTLPRHLIVISPLLRDGKEVPTRVDIEYEWLPQRFFVRKHNSQSGAAQAELGVEMDTENDVVGSKSAARTGHTQVCKKDPLSSTTHSTHIDNMEEGRSQPDSRRSMIKVASWNVRGLNVIDHQRAVEQLVRDNNIHFIGLLETRVSLANIQRVRSNLLQNWSWFADYSGPVGEFGEVYGMFLKTLSNSISDEPWLVLGDFNAVIDDSEVCGRAADTTWPVIGQAISEAIGEFFRTGKLLKQVNATLLALILKVNLPTQVSDYRSIACCNVIYKTITKIIVKRMQLVLHMLIDHSQNAFVLGHSISDNILLAQELLAGYNQAKLPPRCTLKVDIQKAYDSVEWDFLLKSSTYRSISIPLEMQGT